MAVTQSPRVGLTRWGAGTDPFRRAQLDADHGRLDDLVAIDLQVATINDRPAAGTRGRYCFVEATGLVYRDDGAAWVTVGASPDLTPYVKVDRTRNPVPLRTVRSGKDANGIFTTVEQHRVGGNLAERSVLSGGTSPRYTTRTVTEYGTDGTTVLRTTTYTLAYDADDALTSETVA